METKRRITVQDLEMNPFQPLREAPLAVLQAWYDMNAALEGKNMGPFFMSDLRAYIALRQKAEPARKKVELAREKYGPLGQWVVGFLHRKDLKIKHGLD